ncbi:2625_t:CDS:2 [Ambispora gerdemannii]|uniref:2625_t:CDS:1 n=1 Tax=Ambispora gerdemannii TaxID=144530 RepID=A0A9N8Z3Q9_9GLOM|nr:2625_t:CDS:2 [Ambispora gerdemannii]
MNGKQTPNNDFPEKHGFEKVKSIFDSQRAFQQNLLKCSVPVFDPDFPTKRLRTDSDSPLCNEASSLSDSEFVTSVLMNENSNMSNMFLGLHSLCHVAKECPSLGQRSIFLLFFGRHEFESNLPVFISGSTEVSRKTFSNLLAAKSPLSIDVINFHNHDNTKFLSRDFKQFIANQIQDHEIGAVYFANGRSIDKIVVDCEEDVLRFLEKFDHVGDMASLRRCMDENSINYSTGSNDLIYVQNLFYHFYLCKNDILLQPMSEYEFNAPIERGLFAASFFFMLGRAESSTSTLLYINFAMSRVMLMLKMSLNLIYLRLDGSFEKDVPSYNVGLSSFTVPRNLLTHAPSRPFQSSECGERWHGSASKNLRMTSSQNQGFSNIVVLRYITGSGNRNLVTISCDYGGQISYTLIAGTGKECNEVRL